MILDILRTSFNVEASLSLPTTTTSKTTRWTSKTFLRTDFHHLLVRLKRWWRFNLNSSILGGYLRWSRCNCNLRTRRRSVWSILSISRSSHLLWILLIRWITIFISMTKIDNWRISIKVDQNSYSLPMTVVTSGEALNRIYKSDQKY